jgi:hypothetical protein
MVPAEATIVWSEAAVRSTTRAVAARLAVILA